MFVALVFYRTIVQDQDMKLEDNQLEFRFGPRVMFSLFPSRGICDIGEPPTLLL